MQSIERYGVVALVFLAATVGAVIMWDDDESDSDTVAAADRNNPAADSQDRSGRVSLRTGARRSQPLGRSNPSLSPRETDDPRQPGAQETPGADSGRPRGELPSAPTTDPPVPIPGPGEAGFAGGTAGGGIVSPREPAGGDRVNPGSATGPQGRRGDRQDTAANIYVVKPHETLSEISMNELGTWRRWEEIVELNPGLDPLKVREGVRLVMPARGSDPAAPSETPTPAPSTPPAATATPPGESWRVTEGDSLWKIAAATLGNGARWKEIAAVNPGMNPDKLLLGQVIQLPANANVTAGRPATTPREPERTVANATPPAASSTRGRVR